jgi:hypothetical protein
MSDADLGDIFLNFFFLDERVRQHAAGGVDLTKYLPTNLAKPCQSVCWPCWSRPSPYCAMQNLAWLEEVIAGGDPKDPANVFRYDKVEMDLMGLKDYDPSMPWIHKRHLSDGKIAVNPLFVCGRFVRPTGPITEEECWQAIGRFTFMCNPFGIQDTPKKCHPPSLNPGPMAKLACESPPRINGTRLDISSK